MARSKSDISNNAIRMFFQDVGKFYDEQRGFKPFSASNKNKVALLTYFNNVCCYCNVNIDIDFSLDHLIPINKSAIGLHAWGNIVPSCIVCNSAKGQKNWRVYLQEIAPEEVEFKRREAVIESFCKHYNYSPNLKLQDIAENLYQDVGEVALTLINLRYKQAERVIRRIIEEE